MTKVHLLAGPNNSGKSNVLAVAQRALPALRTQAAPDFNELDTPLGAAAQPATEFRLAVALQITDEELEHAAVGRSPVQPDVLRSLFVGSTFDPSNQEGLWFEYGIERDARGRASGWTPTQQQVPIWTKRPETSLFLSRNFRVP